MNKCEITPYHLAALFYQSELQRNFTNRATPTVIGIPTTANRLEVHCFDDHDMAPISAQNHFLFTSKRSIVDSMRMSTLAWSFVAGVASESASALSVLLKHNRCRILVLVPFRELK